MAKKKQPTFDEICAELAPMFEKMGRSCGNEITRVARTLHPNSLLALPLYRGSLLVLKPTKDQIQRGSLSLMLYHDPHWMGREVNKSTLIGFGEKLDIFGQRSGADIFRDGIRIDDPYCIAASVGTDLSWKMIIRKQEAEKQLKEGPSQPSGFAKPHRRRYQEGKVKAYEEILKDIREFERGVFRREK